MIAKALLFLSSLCLLTAHLFAWSNGQLLIWMDSDRANGLRLLAKKFEADWGVKVTIETPENLTNNFLLAVQASKGPDIVIWAHDKVAEWANAGIISPIHTSPEFARKFYPKVWQGVSYKNAIWGYPIALETVTLIYNKKLLPGPPPADLAKLESLNRVIKTKHPGVRTILWDYKSAYYSWGILASAGGYVFLKRGTDYDLNDTGVATPGAIEARSRIVALVRAGILPVGPPQGKGEELLAEGKLAMTISGPWAWPNLIKRHRFRRGADSRNRRKAGPTICRCERCLPKSSQSKRRFVQTISGALPPYRRRASCHESPKADRYSSANFNVSDARAG